MCRQDYVPSCSKRERCDLHDIHGIPPYVDPVLMEDSRRAWLHDVDRNQHHGETLRFRNADLDDMSDIPPWLVITGTVR
jgi:hypothetical protein